MTKTYGYDLDSNRCAVDATSCNGSFSYNAADQITASPGVGSYGCNYGEGEEDRYRFVCENPRGCVVSHTQNVWTPGLLTSKG